MVRRKKLLSIGFFVALIIAATIVFGLSFNGGKTYAAEMTRENGAAVKVLTNKDDSGIRFQFYISNTDFWNIVEESEDEDGNTVYEYNSGVKVGVLIIPEDLLGGDNVDEALNLENASRSGSKISNTELPVGIWRDSKKKANTKETYAYLYNIPSKYYNRKVTTVGYIVNGNETTYSLVVTRCMAEVAKAALANGEFSHAKELLEGYILDYDVVLSYGDTTENLSIEYGEKITGSLFNADNHEKDGYQSKWVDAKGNDFDFANDKITGNTTLTYQSNPCVVVENNATSYSIVKPVNATTQESDAADFLANAIKDSTGVTVPVVTDEGLSYSKTGKYISVGNTAILSGSGVQVPADLGVSGYVLKAKGASVIIAGNSGQGVLNGAFGYAEKAVGYEYFANKAVNIDTKTKVEIGDLAITEIPSFDSRFIGYNVLFYDYSAGTGASRGLRLNYPVLNGSYSGMAHTTTDYINNTKYPRSQYRDYYAVPDYNDQLRYSNPNVRNILVESLKNELEKHEETDGEFLLVLGGPDVSDYCKCSTYGCKNHTASYNAVACANYIAEQIQAYLTGQGSDRKVVIAVSAYSQHADYPSGITLYGGDSVKVGAVWTPVYMNYSASITDSVNRAYKAQLDGWANLCAANKSLIVYDYCVNWSYAYANFDNFRSLQSNLQYYKQVGAVGVYSQGFNWMEGRTASACFLDWRNYLQSELMWNVNADVNLLKDEFFNEYYGAAADAMLAYYDSLTALYASNYNNYSELRTNSADNDAVQNRLNLYQTKYFPEATLNAWLGYIDNAYNAIAGLKTTDAELYATIKDRICLESVSVRYLMAKLYGYEKLAVAERTALFNDILRFGCYPNENENNANSIINDIGITSYRVQKYTQYEAGSAYYEDAGVEIRYAATGATIDFTEEANRLAPQFYHVGSHSDMKLVGTNDGSLAICIYYDCASSFDKFDGDASDAAEHVAEGDDCGVAEIVEVDGNNVIRVTGATGGYPMFKLCLGKYYEAGTVISFDFAAYDPNNSTGHFGLITGTPGNLTWNSLDGSGWYSGGLGTNFNKPLTTFKFTLPTRSDIIVLGANFGVGTFGGVSDVSKIELYFDNIGVASQYTVTEYTQNSDGSYSENTTTAYALNNETIDYTETAKANKPDGYFVNAEKSVLTGVNDGNLVIKVYYDILPAIDAMTFEQDGDMDYVKANNLADGVEIVDSSVVPANGEYDCGKKILKVHAIGSDPTLTFSFGQTLPQGTTISFDLYVINTNSAESGWFPLVLNGVDQGTSIAYWANGDSWKAHWKHIEYTLTSDCSEFVVGLPLAALRDHKISDYTTVTAYFDNIGIETSYTVKTYLPKDGGGYSVSKTETKSALKGETVDYTAQVIANKPSGYIVNTTKSVLTGVNDGSLTI